MHGFSILVSQPRVILWSTFLLLIPLVHAEGTATVVISNERSGNLVFMTDSGDTTDVVSLCNRPRGMASISSSRTVYVACSDDDSVVEFDLQTKTIVSTFENIPGAMSLAIHEPSNRLVISNEGFASLMVVDLETRDTLATLKTGLEPDGVFISDDGSLIFAASENAGLVHVFSAEHYEPVHTILTNLRPRRLAIQKNELWISSEMGSRVEIFDTTNFEKIDEIIFAPKGFRTEQLTPVDVVFDDAKETAFVALGSANHVAIIDVLTRNIEKYILVGRRPWGLALTPDGSKLFVLNGLSDDVTIIDVVAQRPVRTSRTGLVPHSIEILH